ncbi:hypothetical protein CDD81_7754 [Ophiocordyceps australis]|uniref:DUF4048 domain-containing protein n=1 Tax=Ophiocordyceps australis TaxID=1399860 RepID=A0A2C5Y3A1_9HYPO|nr:hypothetical protein CDD81_7754 [Ophiocordyceps australis]
MTAFLLRTCAANRCLALAYNENRQLNRHRHRAPSTRPGFGEAISHRRKRLGRSCSPCGHRRRVSRRWLGGNGSQSLHRLLAYPTTHAIADGSMALQHEIRRRASAPVRPPDCSESAAVTTAVVLPADSDEAHGTHNEPAGFDCQATPAPPPATSFKAAATEARASDAAPTDFTTPRTINRLSLTLPIAPPTSEPSRPPPKSVSASSSSVSQTPNQTSTPASASDVSDFIIAIAAQERRVLELREELGRAESHLASLKKQWTAKEAQIKRHGNHHVQVTHNVAPRAVLDASGPCQRNVELDRRKLLLQSQHQTQSQSTPSTANRRRVIRGGHTRTLSLLSPAHPDATFATNECSGMGGLKRRSVEEIVAQPGNSSVKAHQLTPQPRSACNSPGVPQLVEDFKLGFRAFVEDIRLITVGEEPVRGQVATGRGTVPQQHMGSSAQRSAARDEPSSPWTTRGPQLKKSNALDSVTPTPIGRIANIGVEKPKPTKSKRYSWTPLGLDSLDDSDWCNWETPAPAAKSPRWSGSTIHSPGLEDITPICEVGEESLTPVKSQSASVQTPILSPRLEELLPSVVNRLTPRNLKRTANSLMDEWEKSLVAPDGNGKENESPLS